MSQVVQEILQRIEQLPESDRLLLEQQLAEAKRNRKAEDTRRQDQSHRSQAELLTELRQRSYTPPAGTPESVELLRQAEPAQLLNSSSEKTL
jgi:predicted nucleic acid-binding Zn ribbon protein